MILKGDITVSVEVVLTIQPSSEILIPDGKIIKIEGTVNSSS